MANTGNGNPSTYDRASRELSGVVDRVIWYDESSGAVIARLRNGTGVKGDCEPGGLVRGARYRFFGHWQATEKYGDQFCFATYTTECPEDRRGVVAFLRENCNGIGEAIAGKIYEAFGSKTLEAIRDDPVAVAGKTQIDIGTIHDLSDRLKNCLSGQEQRAKLFGILSGRGFGKVAIAACVRKWGDKAADVISRDPWKLLTADIPRAGFKTVDRLYLERGGDPARLKRQMLAGWEALRSSSDGHTWLPESAFAAGVLAASGALLSEVERAKELADRSGWIEFRPGGSGNLWMAERTRARNEKAIAFHIKRIISSTFARFPIPCNGEISEHQESKFAEVADSPIVILSGTPGTGKTYVAAQVVKLLGMRIGHNGVACCAPTGKAAVRLTETMANAGVPITASTIHQLLGIGRNGHDGKGWGFRHDADMPLPHDLIVVDEVSMLDTDLAASLFAAIPDGALLLLIGDPYQLPPVGHGSPLRDMIAAGLPCAELTEIRRNAGAIVQACADIKEGIPFKTVDRIDIAAGANLRMIECGDERDVHGILAAIFAMAMASGDRDPMTDFQVITPLNDKGEVCRNKLNTLLQGILNPDDPGNPSPQVGEFRVNDKIICLRNCFLTAVRWSLGSDSTHVHGYSPVKDDTGQSRQHYVANGDIGRILAIDAKAKSCVVQFGFPARCVKVYLSKPSGNDGESETGDTKDFALAYAITIHKSQGSEWPYVIVVADDGADRVASRELVYTAISRASEVCLILGKRSTIDRQVRTVSLSKRKTFLRELLTDEA